MEHCVLWRACEIWLLLFCWCSSCQSIEKYMWDQWRERTCHTASIEALEMRFAPPFLIIIYFTTWNNNNYHHHLINNSNMCNSIYFRIFTLTPLPLKAKFAPERLDEPDLIYSYSYTLIEYRVCIDISSIHKYKIHGVIYWFRMHWEGAAWSDSSQATVDRSTMVNTEVNS